MGEKGPGHIFVRVRSLEPVTYATMKYPKQAARAGFSQQQDSKGIGHISERKFHSLMPAFSIQPEPKRSDADGVFRSLKVQI